MKSRFLAYLIITSLATSLSWAEFQVNARTSNDQATPAIAMAPDGNFVVVWSSYFQGDRSNEIFGRLFSADGNPASNEFQANTETSGNQKEPSVAMDDAGNFVVTWQSGDTNNPPYEDIYAQRFDSNAEPNGIEFRVNDNQTGRQLHPKVAMSPTGAFVIVWENSEFWDLDYYEVLFKLYEANGVPIEANVANLRSNCRYPDVAMDGYGNFTIAWMQDDTEHTENIIMFCQFNAEGTATANPRQASTIDFFAISHSSIAMEGSGHFIIVWEGNPGAAAENNIHARRYKFDGSDLTGEFTVNTTTAGAQEYPKVAMNNWREFVVVWNSETVPGVCERDILGQRYDSLYNRLGDEFQANTYQIDDQKYPAVSMKENGEFVTVWQSNGQDGSDYGIFGQFGPRICCADFSGDLFVNFRDFCVLAEEWLKEGNPLRADLVDDNKIHEQDLEAFCQQWLTPCYDCSQADIYKDGKIDFKDYALWAENWQQQGPFDGDITGEGTVDIVDLKALLFHWSSDCL